MPVREKADKADFVIRNNGDLPRVEKTDEEDMGEHVKEGERIMADLRPIRTEEEEMTGVQDGGAR